MFPEQRLREAIVKIGVIVDFDRRLASVMYELELFYILGIRLGA